MSSDTTSLRSDCIDPTSKLLTVNNGVQIQKSKSFDKISAAEEESNFNLQKERAGLRKSWDGIRDKFSSMGRKKKSAAAPKFSNDLNLPIDAYMEQILEAIISLKNIKRVTWQTTKNGEGHQVLFNLESGPRCEDTIRLLSEWGVGEREGTSVSVLPCTIYHEPIHDPLEEKPPEWVAFNDIFCFWTKCFRVAFTHAHKLLDSKQPLWTLFFIFRRASEKNSTWSRFISSVRARLNVANIVSQVKADATITFDFICLIIVAGITAAFGLIEDSTLFLAASMLISPLMGPILAATFGTVIKDKKLTRLGMFNELIGIFLTTLVGFTFGLVVTVLDSSYGIGEALSNEMMSRTQIHSLFVGIMIAIPSGAAVAIAILGENTGSLIGVAISASLLPPAVNAGLLWALSVSYAIIEPKNGSIIKMNYYSEHPSIELGVYGCISMCITITNVICIYVVGVIFLKIKEVSSLASRGQREFWKHDIKIARDYNKTMHTGNNSDLIREFNEAKDRMIHGVGVELLKSVNQQTWSPATNKIFYDNNSTRDLEAIYLSLAANPKRHQMTYSPAHMLFGAGGGPGKYTPPRYLSNPDEEILSSRGTRTDPIDTPASAANHHKLPTHSFPFTTRFTSNILGNGKKRFHVTPASDDPLHTKK